MLPHLIAFINEQNLLFVGYHLFLETSANLIHSFPKVQRPKNHFFEMPKTRVLAVFKNSHGTTTFSAMVRLQSSQLTNPTCQLDLGGSRHGWGLFIEQADSLQDKQSVRHIFKHKQPLLFKKCHRFELVIF